MRLRTVTTWTPRRGKRRRIRLFEAYRNMLGRVRGVKYGQGGHRLWQGLPVEFASWPEFRSWALQAGYCKARSSLDRIDPDRGYLKDNLRWVSRADNSRWRWAGKATAPAYDYTEDRIA